MSPAGLVSRLAGLHARGRLLPLLLVLAVLAVLVHGALRRARPPAHQPAAEASNSPAPPLMPALRPDLEKAPLSYLSDYWLQLGQRARDQIALVGAAHVPALVLEPGVAVTSLAAADALDADPGRGPDGDARPAAGHPAAFRVAAVDVDEELALIELPQAAAAQAFVPAATASLRPGSLLAAVTRAADGRLRVAPGHLVAVAPSNPSGADGDLEVTAMFHRRAAAAAVVDVDGRLVGGAFESSRGVRLLSTPTLFRALARLRENPLCLAIDVTDLDAAARRLLGVEHGVLVERVRRSAFDGGPALQAGDVLLEWHKTAVDSAETFRRLYAAAAPGTRVAHVALRGGQRVAGASRMPRQDCRVPPAARWVLPRLGATLEWRPADAGPQLRVLEVQAGGPAARAGLREGDRLDALSGVPADAARLRAALEAFERRPRPLLLTLRRGDRARMAVVAAPVE